MGNPQFPGCHNMSFADVNSLPPLSLSKNISASDHWPLDRRENAERVHRENAEQVNCTKPCLADFCFLPPATANGWANVRFKIDIGRFPATCSRPLPLQPLSTASLMCWVCLGIILTLPTFGSYLDTSLHVVSLVKLSWALLSTYSVHCAWKYFNSEICPRQSFATNPLRAQNLNRLPTFSKNHLTEFPASSFGSCFSCLAVLSHNFSVKTDTNTEREKYKYRRRISIFFWQLMLLLVRTLSHFLRENRHKYREREKYKCRRRITHFFFWQLMLLLGRTSPIPCPPTSVHTHTHTADFTFSTNGFCVCILEFLFIFLWQCSFPKFS